MSGDLAKKLGSSAISKQNKTTKQQLLHKMAIKLSEKVSSWCKKLTSLRSSSKFCVSFSPPFSFGLGVGYGRVTIKVIGLPIEYIENQPTQVSKNTTLTQKK